MNEISDNVIIYGDNILKKPSEDITDFNGELQKIFERMVMMLYENNGVGLAAPQVGLSKRFAIIDLSFGEEVDNILPIVNPEILESSGEATEEEGCLSIPGIWEDVTRPDHIYFRYHDLEGELHEREAEGFLARVIQHETDHLNGILFVDRLSSVKRQLLTKQLRTLSEKGALT